MNQCLRLYWTVKCEHLVILTTIILTAFNKLCHKIIQFVIQHKAQQDHRYQLKTVKTTHTELSTEQGLTFIWVSVDANFRSDLSVAFLTSREKKVHPPGSHLWGQRWHWGQALHDPGVFSAGCCPTPPPPWPWSRWGKQKKWRINMCDLARAGNLCSHVTERRETAHQLWTNTSANCQINEQEKQNNPDFLQRSPECRCQIRPNSLRCLSFNNQYHNRNYQCENSSINKAPCSVLLLLW